MDPGELAWSGLFLIRTLGQEKILYPFDGEQLDIVKISDHSMVLEILKQKGQPICGVCAHAEIDHPIMNLGIDLNLITLRLVGDRLPGAPSAIFGDFVLCRAHMNGLIASPLPFSFFNSAIYLGRLALTSNKIGTKLEIRQALIF